MSKNKSKHWKNKKFRSRRNWLNPIDHDDTGAISCSVSKEGKYVSAYMSIRDCSRQIELNFDISYYARLDSGITSVTKEYNNRMKKLQIIEDAVKGIKEDLTTSYEMLVKEIETAPKKEDVNNGDVSLIGKTPHCD